ncbi:MAG TPA: hypothetical protein PLT68_13100, partial [Actinomycetota bacterium]|nr:hypothetical protein [Actinomycetota bacterium]
MQAVDSGNKPARIVAIVSVIVVLQVVLVLLFAWASSRQAPHNLPLAVAGPAPAVKALVVGIEKAKPGAFEFITVADDPAAQAAVTNRDAYGALVLGQSGTTLYTAPAASTSVANMLAQALPAALTEANPQAQVSVQPLVPNPPDDPNGLGLPSSLTPLGITSIAAGAAIGLLIRRRSDRVWALLGFAVLAGVFSTWALQGVIGALTGTWLANAGVMALLSLGISAGTAGLATLVGVGGVGLSAAVVFFFGMPFSGAATAWQMVPTPWGQIAQYLPVGAGNTALRGVAFFDGAGATPGLVVLAVWAVVGLLLTGLLRGSAHAASEPEPGAEAAV